VFFQNLSVDDTLFTCQSNLGLPDTYTQDAANEWCLQDTAPAEPTTLTAAAGTPADTSIALDWTASATASVGSYRVYSNDETCLNTTAGELGLLATVNAPTTAYTATALTPATTYCFVVTAVSGTDETAIAVDNPDLAGDNTVEMATSGAIDGTAPFITDARVTTDANLQDRFDEGDVVTLTFNEDMADDIDTTGVFVLTDGDGDTFNLSCAAPATVTCVLSDDPITPANVDRVLTMTVLGAIADTNGGGNGILNMPATITTTNASVRDQAGNIVSLITSTDVIIDKEAP
jgi:hypothetical protein